MILKKDFTKSKDFREEYCAAVVEVGKLFDIEGADNLKRTVINGFDIVVNKNEVKEGDIMIYCKNETRLNKDFLAKNSMYDDSTLNEDHEKKGYISSKGRVRMIKLRGCPSYGLLIKPEAIGKWFNDSVDFLESLIDTDSFGNPIAYNFDTVNGKQFCEVYVPEVNTPRNGHGNSEGKSKNMQDSFNRMIPGNFKLHYDTKQLNCNMYLFNPDSDVTISVKMHGTSAIFGNVLCKMPKYGGLYTKFFNKLPKFLRKTKEEYTDIYSSRKIIKNANIKLESKTTLAKTDEYFKFHEILKGKIPEGYTIYGEIVGYKDSGKMIQKGYDYGCKPGENKFMIYRVNKNGYECSPSMVVDFTNILINSYKDECPEIKDIIPLPVLYAGPLSKLYPAIEIDENWHANVLASMKCDKRFNMEENEPLCLNKVPREGIVIRIDEDPHAEAFKLKCNKFMLKEAKDIDAGNVDSEMEEAY